MSTPPPGLTPAQQALAERLIDFLEGLRGDRYNIDTGQMIAAQRLLVELAARGLLPHDLKELGPLIGPIVCGTRDEQVDFAGRFDAWVGRLEAASGSGDASGGAETAPAATSDEEFQLLQSRLARTRWITRALALSFLLLGVASSLVLHFILPRPSASDITGSAARSPIAAAWRLIQPWIAPTAVMGMAALALLALGLVLQRRLIGNFLRKPDPAREPGTAPPTTFVVPPVDPPRLIEDAAVVRLAREFRRWRSLGSGLLDVTATVASTARRGGRVWPVWARRQGTPEYLILVDRQGARDHQARLADELVGRLENHEVLIERYDFQGDPRACTPLRRPGASWARPLLLRELAARYPDHRLILFSDGAGLIDPLTGEFAGWSQPLALWPERAVMTPVPPRDWGPRESLLGAEGFHVLPANPAGLAELIEGLAAGTPADLPPADRRDTYDLTAGAWLPSPEPLPPRLRRNPRRWLDRLPPDDDEIERLIADLTRYLGEPGMLWLSACAVFPVIDWDFTVGLGQHLTAPGGLTLSTLARLPWFRYGSMPDWLRDRLIKRLRPKLVSRVQAVVRAVFFGVRPASTGASLEYSEDRRNLLARIWKQFQNKKLDVDPEDDPRTDLVLRRFMSTRAAQRTDFPLPRDLLERLRAVRPGRTLRHALARLNQWVVYHRSRSLEVLHPRRVWSALVHLFLPEVLLFARSRRRPAAWESSLRESGRSTKLVVLLDMSQRAGGAFPLEVSFAITSVRPDDDLLLIRQPIRFLSNQDPEALAQQLAELIDQAVEGRQLRGGSYQSITLVSEGFFSMLLRKALLLRTPPPETTTVGRVSGRPSPPWGPWLVSRIVVLGPWGGGLSLRLVTTFLFRRGSSFTTVISNLVVRTWFLFAGRLFRSFLESSPFVVNLSLDWTRLRRAGVPLPTTVAASGGSVYADLGETGGDWGPTISLWSQSEVYRFGGTREWLGEALTYTLSQSVDEVIPAVREDPRVTRVVLVITGLGAGVLRATRPAHAPETVELVELKYGMAEVQNYCLIYVGYSGPFLSDGGFMAEYAKLVARYPKAKISVVAHSFGTLLVTRMLSRYAGCVFDRVVLLGSIVSRDFPWRVFTDQTKQVAQVVNLCASGDWVSGVVFALFERPALSIRFLFGHKKNLGSSGFDGFTESSRLYIFYIDVNMDFEDVSVFGRVVDIQYIKGGHRAGFRDEVMERLLSIAMGESVRVVLKDPNRMTARPSGTIGLLQLIAQRWEMWVLIAAQIPFVLYFISMIKHDSTYLAEYQRIIVGLALAVIATLAPDIFSLLFRSNERKATKEKSPPRT